MGELRERLAALCARYSIQSLYAFGSRAFEARELVDGARKALATSASDLDLAVRGGSRGRVSVREKVQIAIDMEELFHVSRVDLVLLDEADPFLAANVIRGERLFSRDALAEDEYELYVLRRAGDLAPLERERLSMIEGR